MGRLYEHSFPEQQPVGTNIVEPRLDTILHRNKRPKLPMSIGGGFWQGLKCEGEMRLHVFELAGAMAKNAGKAKSAECFEIAGEKLAVGSPEHEDLIREAIRQKILQNPEAAEALRQSQGTITHQIPGKEKPIFKMERMLMSIRKELWGY